jgi:hypothetical protein
MASHHTTEPAKQQISVEQLYDLLMEQIEPDLMLETIPLLDYLYLEETPEQWKIRAERYEKAFATFEMNMEKLLGAWNKNLVAFKDDAMNKLKKQSERQESDEISTIDRSITEA